MKDFARRKRVVACWMAGAAFAVVAHGALGQVRLPEIFAMPEVHSAKAPGYLGVEVTDVDAA